MKRFVYGLTIFLSLAAAGMLMTGCGGGNRDAGKVLTVEEVDPGDVTGGSGTDSGTTVTDGTGATGDSGDGTLHPMFSRMLGVPISNTSSGIIDPDPTGHTANTDYDGDGIPNAHEIVSNPYVADYPRIVTRVSAPITMEIRISYSSVSDNHTETIEDSGVKDTISNSMEDRQYTQANEKTTPYVTKESYEKSGSHSESFGDTETTSRSSGGSVNFGGFGGSANSSRTNTTSHNESVSNSFSNSAMSETTVFEDVDYIDNLSRNGVEFTNDTVETMSQNFRKSETLKNTENIGPNDGVVRAALFLKNETVNMPVKISNVICTLTFRTPAGEFLPVKTFKLRNEDYSEFNQSIYGNEELGPYTIEVANLNTYEVMKALENGYIPQIHVVSYDMHKVEDSNYNPGVENLKIIEETAKGRTALIKIAGTNLRETYRVAAFDVNENGDLIPGISLKKALFNILRSKTGGGEQWSENPLTVDDDGLKWKPGSADPDNYVFADDIEGNSWDKFETYVKTYTDEFNVDHKIETIKRIGELQKYNPFNPKDNPSYNPNELLSETEINKMKYWIIYHNGRYFNGDINDPIWAGERYEIVCIDIKDFNEHFQGYTYTPIQSLETVYLDTRWNRLNNAGPFDRSTYLGKIIKGDVIHLEVDLLKSRSLFNSSSAGASYQLDTVNDLHLWNDDDFKYTFQSGDEYVDGIPGEFSHMATGGTNNITVSIDESQYAQWYEIVFGDAGASTDTWKKILVSSEDLSKNNGKVRITRNSIDTESNPVGKIEGGITYRVNVRAHGSVYGVDVSSGSVANNHTGSLTLVEEAQAGTLPGEFFYSTSGLLNSIDVRIAEGTNTEYYIIEYQGPFNYDTGGGDPPVVTQYGYPGVNSIVVENPSGEIVNPGVYRINVYAVNNNNMGSGMASSTGEKYVLVSYERYRDQKVYSPVVRSDLESMDSIDLEVNFNDGSGWYRLKLSDFDTGPQSIDCRYTSYVEYDKQKFHLFFRVPDGTGSGVNETVPSLYNVFAGGRDVADIYIRTSADQKYRDTFWPKSSAANDYYVSTPTSVTDFISYWINQDYTDASYIEDTLGGSYTGTFAFSSTDIGNYFFSPYERRILGLKVKLQDSLGEADTSRIEVPTFTAGAGNKSITATLQTANYADSVQVFWKQVDGLTDSQLNALMNDSNLNGWDSSTVIPIASLDGGNSYTIENLQQYSYYVVAVKSYNEFGKVSEPAFHTVTGDLARLEPWSADVPVAPAAVSLNLGSDGHSIYVNNIYVPGEKYYQLQYHSESGSWVDYTPDIRGNGVDPLSCSLSGLNYWDRYYVRVRAVNEHITDGEGPWTTMMIDTAQVGGGPGSVAAAWRNTYIQSTYNFYGRILIDNLGSSLVPPQGTTHYSISWRLDASAANPLLPDPSTTGETGKRAISNRASIQVIPSQLLSKYVSSSSSNVVYVGYAEINMTLTYYNSYGDSVSYNFFTNLGTWLYHGGSTGWTITY